VWAAAFGQIFFSLSIGFGIMITYSSYVDRRSDMPGAGLVVGFANSGFELLAGIGVFAALGFMAQAQGVAVDEVAAQGLGLAFVVFPAMISEAPAGALIGVLFFGSLVIAGLTSLVSVIEVVISAVRDKFEMTRVGAAMAVGVPATLVSVVLFSTTSGVYVLDIVDHFINQYGILLVAIVSMLVVTWGLRALPGLADHLNATGSLRLGRPWFALIGVVAPAALAYVLVDAFVTDLRTPYEGYPSWMLNVLGWGSAVVVIVFGVLAARVSWRPGTTLDETRSTSKEIR
jgi:NSS family neurotransmitter:Na+ symporter